MKRILAVPLLLAALAALFLPGSWGPGTAFLLALAGAALADPGVIRGTLRAGLVLGAVFAAALTAGVAAAWSSWGMGTSLGVELLLRILTVALVTGTVARSVDGERLAALAGRAGLGRLGQVLGLALNTLPHLLDTLDQVWGSLRLRSGGRLRALVRAPRLAEVVLAHAGRLADEAAGAAALRGLAVRRSAPAGLARGLPVVVVTGPGGGGKTTAVEEAVELIRRGAGVSVAGFVQPGMWGKDGREAFRVRDLVTGDEAILARRVERGRGEHGTRFVFSGEGFALAARALARVQPGAVLVADELGPVELRGGGHMPALREALGRPGLRGAVFSVRRHLVPALLAALDAADATVVTVDGAAAPAREIARRFCGGGSSL